MAGRVDRAKSYLSQVENERRRRPPTDSLLAAIEAELRFHPGALVAAARWSQLPASVRRELIELRAERERTRTLAEHLGRVITKGSGTGRPSPDGPRPGAGDDALMELLSRLDARTGGAGSSSVPRGVLPAEVPIMNSGRGGYPREFPDLSFPGRVADEYVRVPELNDADAFAVRVVGDLMRPDYRPGDVVVFSPARPWKSGGDCFVVIDPNSASADGHADRPGRCHFARVYEERSVDGASFVRLQPLNPTFPATIVPSGAVRARYPAVVVIRRLEDGGAVPELQT